MGRLVGRILLRLIASVLLVGAASAAADVGAMPPGLSFHTMVNPRPPVWMAERVRSGVLAAAPAAPERYAPADAHCVCADEWYLGGQLVRGCTVPSAEAGGRSWCAAAPSVGCRTAQHDKTRNLWWHECVAHGGPAEKLAAHRATSQRAAARQLHAASPADLHAAASRRSTTGGVTVQRTVRVAETYILGELPTVCPPGKELLHYNLVTACVEQCRPNEERLILELGSLKVPTPTCVSLCPSGYSPVLGLACLQNPDAPGAILEPIPSRKVAVVFPGCPPGMYLDVLICRVGCPSTYEDAGLGFCRGRCDAHFGPSFSPAVILGVRGCGRWARGWLGIWYYDFRVPHIFLRTSGTALPTYCPTGFTNILGLCYQNCPAGFPDRVVDTCYSQTCPNGYTRVGLFCAKNVLQVRAIRLPPLSVPGCAAPLVQEPLLLHRCFSPCPRGVPSKADVDRLEALADETALAIIGGSCPLCEAVDYRAPLPCSLRGERLFASFGASVAALMRFLRLAPVLNDVEKAKLFAGLPSAPVCSAGPVGNGPLPPFTPTGTGGATCVGDDCTSAANECPLPGTARFVKFNTTCVDPDDPEGTANQVRPGCGEIVRRDLSRGLQGVRLLHSSFSALIYGMTAALRFFSVSLDMLANLTGVIGAIFKATLEFMEGFVPMIMTRATYAISGVRLFYVAKCGVDFVGGLV